jgi:hypothetical protein
MSTVDEQHTRISKKIFSVIATMGGYLKALVLFFYLYKPFLERKYYIELINHLYNVEENKNKQELKNLSKAQAKANDESKSGSKSSSGGRKSRLLSWGPLKTLFKKGKKVKEGTGGEASAINLRESQALSGN